MKSRPTVALLIETSNSYGRGLLQGVVRYTRELQPRWALNFVEQGRQDEPPRWLARWRGQGIIARIETAEIAAAVEATGVPVVDVSAARQLPEIPWVETDDEAIAQLAADHLLERGFRHFAFCGYSKFNWSNLRRDALIRYLAELGLGVEVFEAFSPTRKTAWEGFSRPGLAQWLRRLPKPVGVFACYDVVGAEILDISADLGLAVPEELAVLGTSNDVFCDLCQPPLTSIITDEEGAGYTAASILDRMMHGEDVPSEPVLLKPLGIATRQSTDVLAIDDPDVARAVKFIREHACDGINVGDLLARAPVSRKVLEQRFHKYLGRSPHQEILRWKIARAEAFLLETDLKLDTIAERTGFQRSDYLCVAFKRITGMTPGRFRRHRRRTERPSG